jgi:glucose/arabinose dehydrogenase
MPNRLRLALLSLGFVLLAAMATLLLTPSHTARAAGEYNYIASLELVAEGLTQPVTLQEAPDESGRLFIVDQTGRIWVKPPDGPVLAVPFLNIADRMVPLNPGYDERGLLGLAFHPEYATNGRFFVYYSAPLREEAPDDWNHTSHISEFQVSESDPNVADPASEQVLLYVDQPQSNHNGGTVAFSPQDGYLYISLGDGGAGNDVGVGHVEDWYAPNAGGNGQDIQQNLLGSILRIDVNSGDPYGIPADNPFVGEMATFTEQYAYGFRNPYRFSFDLAGTHQLFVADAGQNLYEEVSIVENGGNYGWNVKEGRHCFSTATPNEPPADCPDTDPEGDPLIDPIVEYSHSEGIVVVGANVYRGTTFPDWQGVLFFGDWSSSFPTPDGSIYAATPPDSGVGLWSYEEVIFPERPNGIIGHYLLGLGQDLRGELYALTTDTAGPTGTTGRVYRLVPRDPTAVTLDALGTSTTAPLGIGAVALVGLTLALGLLALTRRRHTT